MNTPIPAEAKPTLVPAAMVMHCLSTVSVLLLLLLSHMPGRQISGRQFRSDDMGTMLQEAQAAVARLRAANQQLQLELDSVRQAAGDPAGTTDTRSAASASNSSHGHQGRGRPSAAVARSVDESVADRRIRELEATGHDSEQLIRELQDRLAEAEYANPLFSGTRSLPSPLASSTADSASLTHASELRHRQHTQPQQWSPRTADLQQQTSSSTIKVVEAIRQSHIL